MLADLCIVVEFSCGVCRGGTGAATKSSLSFQRLLRFLIKMQIPTCDAYTRHQQRTEKSLWLILQVPARRGDTREAKQLLLVLVSVRDHF